MLHSSPFDEFVARHGAAPRRGLFGLLVHELGRRIVGGDFGADGLLPNEDELIVQLGVSRTIVREAMKSLASKGLVAIRPKTGTRVRPRASWHHTDPDVMVWHYETGPSLEYLDQLADLRRVLEPAAAAWAAQRASAGEITAIGEALARMRATTETPAEHAEADRAFHAAIFAASHNMVFARLFDVIAIVIFGNAVNATAGVSAGYRRSIPFHEAVFEAIAGRDPAEAARAANRLLDSWNPTPERFKKPGAPAPGATREAVR